MADKQEMETADSKGRFTSAFKDLVAIGIVTVFILDAARNTARAHPPA